MVQLAKVGELRSITEAAVGVVGSISIGFLYLMVQLMPTTLLPNMSWNLTNPQPKEAIQVQGLQPSTACDSTLEIITVPPIY